MIVDILAFKIGLSSEKPFNLVCSDAQRCSGQAAHAFAARVRLRWTGQQRAGQIQKNSLLLNKRTLWLLYSFIYSESM